jgi:SAM-dependent methyltransferase
MDVHKIWLAGVFDRAASSYDQVAAPYHHHFARRLVEHAAIPPGADLLDVACGRGAVLIAAATTAGSLSGCDISPVMLDLARAVRPSGRVAVSVWAEEDPDWQWESDLFAAAGTPRNRATVRAFDRAEEVLDLLHQAGFTDLRAFHETTHIIFATEDEWWAWNWSFSRRGMLEQLAEDAIATVRQAASARMADLRSAGGYRMRLDARIVTGVRGAG